MEGAHRVENVMHCLLLHLSHSRRATSTRRADTKTNKPLQSLPATAASRVEQDDGSSIGLHSLHLCHLGTKLLIHNHLALQQTRQQIERKQVSCGIGRQTEKVGRWAAIEASQERKQKGS